MMDDMCINPAGLPPSKISPTANNTNAAIIPPIVVISTLFSPFFYFIISDFNNIIAGSLHLL